MKLLRTLVVLIGFAYGFAAAADDVLNNSVGIKMKLVPAGTFMMGRPKQRPNPQDLRMGPGAGDQPSHAVTLTKPFFLSVYEVTNAQFRRVVGHVPSKWKHDDHPVENVSRDLAERFCRELSAIPDEQNAGRVYRLPTEAEWEYACRAGTKTAYSFGEDESRLQDYAWFMGQVKGATSAVGEKKPNPWGFYDMHGNVWERCSDWYAEYPKGKVTDPRGPSGGGFGQNRTSVLRGGAFNASASQCTSTYRLGDEHSLASGGIRVAMNVTP